MPLDLTPILEAYRTGRIEPHHVAELLNEVEQLRATCEIQTDRHAKCWDALCGIGEALDRAGYPVLIPERAMKAGEQVDTLIGDMARLRAAAHLEWCYIGFCTVSLMLHTGRLKNTVVTMYRKSNGWQWEDYNRALYETMPLGDTLNNVKTYVESLGLPCAYPGAPDVS